VLTHLRQLRRILDTADTVPFRAGTLTTARLRTILGDDLPGTFRLPVEVTDLVSDVHAWLQHERYLLPHIDAMRPPCPRSARQLQLAIDCGAVEIVLCESVSSYAPVFCVEQHGGKLRLIFDLRQLNFKLSDASFSANDINFETLHDVPSFLETARATVASKLDLRSAFWQLPTADSLSRHMGVRLQGGVVGRWRVLPFGLAHAPRIFQTLTNAFIRRWRRMGIATLGYLDDIMVAATDAATHARHVVQVIADLREAGIRVSGKKAFIMPYTKLEFLGILFDIPGHRVAVADSRLDRIADDARELANDAQATGSRGLIVRDILALVGRIQFAAFVLPLLTFHRSALLALARGRQPSDVVPVDADAMADLRWWSDEAKPLLSHRWFSWRTPPALRVRARVTGESLTPVIEAVLSTDASDTGIGFTTLDGSLQAEPLPGWLRDAPSAARELFGVTRVLEVASSALPPGSAIRVLCDNQSVSSSVHGKSVSVAVAKVGQRLLRASLASGVWVDVEWLPRELLQSEDAASRWTDGTLAFAKPDPSWLRLAWNRAWGQGSTPLLELCACDADRVAPDVPCLTRLPMPGSRGELLSFDWARVSRGWAYPPFALLRPILLRLATFHSPPDIAWLLPDVDTVRHRLANTHTFMSGPTSVVAPSGAVVQLRRPLVLCLPRHAATPAAPRRAGPGREPPAMSAAHAHTPSTTTAAHTPSTTATAHTPSTTNPTGAAAAHSRNAAGAAPRTMDTDTAPADRAAATIATTAAATSGVLPTAFTGAAAAATAAATSDGACHPDHAATTATFPHTATTAPASPPTVGDPARYSWSEVKGNVLAPSLPDAHILHCISARAEMSAGFAEQVTPLCIDDMPSIRASAQRCLGAAGLSPAAVLSRRGPASYWGHLVTKVSGSAYPTLHTLDAALRGALHRLALSPLSRVHMPAIGCGIDGLDWPDVRRVVQAALVATPRRDGTPWHVTVFHLH
jgi:hypothetical protein